MTLQRLKAKRAAFSLALCFIVLGLNSCRFFTATKAAHRLHRPTSESSPSLILEETIGLERSLDGTSIALSFDTRAAVDCRFGFYPIGEKPANPLPLNVCTGKSSTKFSEIVSGVTKDKLVTLVIKTWASVDKEMSASLTVVNETVPSADAASINLVSVDLGASRFEFTTLDSSAVPSAFVASGQGESGCWPTNEKSPGNLASRKAAIVQSMSSQGYINTITARVTPTTFASTFKMAQRQSTEWTVSAKTAAGFGKLRLAKPTMLSSSEFKSENSIPGILDSLEDIDPPGLKLSATTPLVVKWVLDGAGKNSTATLTIAPSGAFAGISCRSPATALQITVPAALVAKIPPNLRLWTTLRIDSWQALENERWVIRVSDWTSMGVQRI
jgi:hypothetical protein